MRNWSRLANSRLGNASARARTFSVIRDAKASGGLSGVTPSTATRERMAAPAPISITTLRRSCRSARRDFTVSAGVSQSRLTVASAFAWFARAPYSAKTKPRGSAENRSAAALGGLKLASAVTPPTSVSLASKTPNSIGSKPALEVQSSMVPDSRAETVPLTTALRTGRRCGSGGRSRPEKSPLLAQAQCQGPHSTPPSTRQHSRRV